MDENENENAQQQFNIEMPEELSGGVYSNFVIIGHSGAEFVMDFVQMLPGMPKGKVRSRIIMTPQHAKRLLAALTDNIDKFEASFGTIETPDNNMPFPPTFGGPAGIA